MFHTKNDFKKTILFEKTAYNECYFTILELGKVFRAKRKIDIFTKRTQFMWLIFDKP